MHCIHTVSPSARRTMIAAVVPLLALGAESALAQQIEEIVVTAQKREQSLQDVPIAVSAFQASDLVDSGIESQREIAMMVPNVAVNVNASFIAPYIRGVGTQYANPGLEPSVATYFNDIYISRPTAGFMQFADIERVEVLKGPQGTLYGRNTTGGAIRVITKDPTEDFEARIGGTLGNYDKYAVDGVVSGPLAEGLTGRLSAQYEQREPWVHNITGGEDVEDRELYMVHGKLKWQPTERLSIKVDADTMEKDDREGIAFVPLYTSAPEQTGAAFGGQIATRFGDYSGNVHADDGDDLTQHFDAHGGQARVDYEFESFTLSYIAGYRYMRFTGIADLDATSVPLFDVKTVIDKTEDYSHEVQVVSSGAGPWDWVAGVYYMKEEAVDNFGLSGMFIDAGTGFAGSWIGGDGEIEIESFAPYGQIY
jgi:iron complex outermembrane receptor protein